jgi:hypothetical protein
MISSAVCKHPEPAMPALDPEDIINGLADLVPGAVPEARVGP